MITKATNPITLKLKRDSEWDEWVVSYRIEGKHNEERSYRTDCKEDAISTMAFEQSCLDKAWAKICKQKGTK